MSSPSPITLQLDRRILEHPRAYHLRRMRQGIWLYLDVLARLSGRAGTLDLEPAAVGRDMGLPEGTVRSWLGHLRKGGYLKSERREGRIRVTMAGDQALPGLPVHSVEDLTRALGEPGHEVALHAALNLYSRRVIERSLKAALLVPQSQIRHSRTSLFLYLLKNYDHEK